MSEFDEKLSAILSDQNAMGQIMALAQSLSGPKQDGGGEAELAQPAGEDSVPFPGFDMGRDVRLLEALRPYLHAERQGKLDKMLEVLQLIRLFRNSKGQ